MALLDFERFGITAEDVKSGNYSYIIGFDLGDGEVSAAYWDFKDSGFLKPEDLKLDINENCKLLSGLFLDEEGKAYIGTVKAIESLQEAKGKLFTNFKIPPHRLISGEKYANSDKTNLELMCLLLREVLLRIHDIALKDKFYDAAGKPKKGILAIGCPSSPEWTSDGTDVVYANMLNKALEGCPLDLKIVIMPESRASLVKVYKERNSIKSQIKNGVIVIDHGSSTLDITAIDFKNNIQYDFSIPLGAHLIERQILRKAVTENGRKESELKGGKSGIVFQRLALRTAKEGCFSNPAGVYKLYIDYYDDEDQRIKITSDTMREITHKEEVTYSTKLTGPVRGSWAELHKNFILQCLDKVDGDFNPKQFNGIVVLTGGASKMGFIEETIHEIFDFSNSQVVLVVDSEPSYCVSRGLAWATYTDLMALNLIDTVKQRIADSIRADFSNLKALISKEIAPIIYDYSKEKLEGWVESGDNETTTDFARRIEKEFMDASTPEGKKRYDEISEAIKKAVTEYLENSGPDGVRATIVKVVNDVFSSTFPGKIDGKNVPEFTISDDEWGKVIAGTTADDLKFSSSLVAAMDLENTLISAFKYVIAFAAFFVALSLTIITWGRVDMESISKKIDRMFLENQKLSKSKRQSAYKRVVDKKEDTISKIEVAINKSNAPEESKKEISNQIINILTPAIDKAVNMVSIYF